MENNYGTPNLKSWGSWGIWEASEGAYRVIGTWAVKWKDVRVREKAI